MVPVDASGPDATPEWIGPYRIIRKLGEGGMGVVYLAEQTEPVRRKVAVKAIKAGMDTAQVVARFESERQALAVMDHPGIAKVFDAGSTELGRPYFVMELVSGVPITEYADAHRLDLRDRIRLFAQVCRAVQHAHQKGVIHRDLKPSNVLVTQSEGHPLARIIDFGIAKATQGHISGATLTQIDNPVGTAAYMSPEQLDAGAVDIDTRADIYSLGVLLYELVTGTLPFEDEEYYGWRLVALLTTKDPPAPTTRFRDLPADERELVAAARGVNPKTLQRELRGDLGWIVLRALERDRDRRYETANGLALELERFLRQEPVLAGPPGAAYRMRKFVRRHRIGVGFSVTLAVLLVAFATTMTVQAERISRARGVAQARQGQAEDLIGFMLGDLRTRLTRIGQVDVLDEVGDQALEYFASVPESELTDAELFRRSQALRQIGQVRIAQGDLDAATRAFDESFSLARGLAERDPSNGPWQVGLGASYFYLGFIRWRQGDFDGALENFMPYLEITEDLVERAPDSLDYRLELSYANSNIASVLESKGDLEGALGAFEATLAAKQDLVELQPSNQEWQLSLAHTYNAVAVVQRKLGDLEGAVANHREELAIKEDLVAADSTNQEYQRYLAVGHAYLGALLIVTGEIDNAMTELASARSLYRSLAARDTANAEWRRSLANSERLLAQAHLERGDAPEALRDIESGRARLADLLRRSPDNRQWQQEMARTETTRSEALAASRQWTASIAAARRGVQIAEPLFLAEPDDPDASVLFSAASIALGNALAGNGDDAGARAAWKRAFDAVAGPANRTRHTELLASAAVAAIRLGRTEDARPLIQELKARGYRRPIFVALSATVTPPPAPPG